MAASRMRLHGALIFAVDIERVATFYRDGLGLREQVDAARPGWIQFDGGGAIFALHAIPPSLAADIEITSPPAPRGDAAIKRVFETADLAAARVHLESCGAVVSEPIPGAGCDVWDPEGNVFHRVEGRGSDVGPTG